MGSWNIQDSIAHLSKNCVSKSIGKCARYVRQAMEAGGLSTDGRPGSAYQYKGYLPKIGFTALGDITGKDKQREWSNKNAKPGDISVMDHGEHGHICMWNGKQWISDFPQNNMWVYKGEGTCTIFRYGGEVDGSLEPWNGQVGGGNGSGGDGLSSVAGNMEYTTPREKQVDHKLFLDFLNIKKQLFALILEGEGVVCTPSVLFKDKYLFEDVLYKNADGKYDTSRIDGYIKMYNINFNINVHYSDDQSVSEFTASAALGNNPDLDVGDLGITPTSLDGVDISKQINENDVLKASHFPNTNQWIAAYQKHGLTSTQINALIACMMYECNLKHDVINKLEFNGKGAKGTEGWHAGEGTVGFTFWNLKKPLIDQYNKDPRKKKRLTDNWNDYNSPSGVHIMDLDLEDAALFTALYYNRLINSTKNADLDTTVAEFYLEKAGRGGSAKKGKTPVEKAMLRSEDYMRTHAKQGCKAKNTFLLTLQSARLLAGQA